MWKLRGSQPKLKQKDLVTKSSIDTKELVLHGNRDDQIL